MEHRTETVIFRSFYEKGFALPVGAFFRGLLFFYGLEVTHLKPNSIAQIAIFIHLCEAFLGIAPHLNLWQPLYHLRGYPFCFTRVDRTQPWSCVTATRGGTRSGSWCRTRPPICPAALAARQSLARAGKNSRRRRRWSRWTSFSKRLPAYLPRG